MSPYERLTQGIAALERQRVWETRNRLGLLWCHAVGNMVAGVLTLVGGTAAVFAAHLPHADKWTGIPALLGGLTLACGLASRPRRLVLEVSGLVLIGLWDVAMGVGFIVAASMTPSPWYPAAVYATLLALVSVHLYTLAGYRAIRL